MATGFRPTACWKKNKITSNETAGRTVEAIPHGCRNQIPMSFLTIAKTGITEKVPLMILMYDSPSSTRAKGNSTYRYHDRSKAYQDEPIKFRACRCCRKIMKRVLKYCNTVIHWLYLGYS